jgi:hypothetical protein
MVLQIDPKEPNALKGKEILEKGAPSKGNAKQ